MAAIDKMLQETGDPRYYAADKPMQIAREVATRRGIFPALPATTPAEQQQQAPAPAQAPAQPQRKFQAAPPVPASGNARSQQSSPVSIGGINPEDMSEDQYMSLKESWSN